MLQEIDYTGKKRSKYICDKCGKPINTSTQKRYKVNIDVFVNKNSKKILKRYDLCRHCASVLVHTVEKGK